MIPRIRTNIKHGVAAPHKPVLLLAVLKAYELGILHDNKVPLSPELVALFKQIWGYLVITNHQPNISYPFFHLTGDQFWHLVPKPGMDDFKLLEAKARNLSTLDAVIDYAEIEPSLAVKMMQPQSRAIMVEEILAKYFPKTRTHYNATETAPNLLEGIDDILLHTPQRQYLEEVGRLYEAAEEGAEEIYLRSAAFKRLVPQVYQYTCALSGWRVTTAKNDQLLDACHIVPFAQTHNDTIQNGIALSPTFHRAFDRGLVGLDRDYRVIVSERLVENDSHWALGGLARKRAHLPSDKRFWPAQEYLEMHRQVHGLQGDAMV